MEADDNARRMIRPMAIPEPPTLRIARAAHAAMLAHAYRGLPDEACGLLVAGMGKGDPTAAFLDAIRALGAHLARVLPREAGDRNEIADALVVIDE